MNKVMYSVGIKDYYSQLRSVILDPSTIICIDTNILALLFRLNEEARQDLYRLFKSFSPRFIVPNWAIFEYTDKSAKNQLQNYSSNLKKMKAELSSGLAGLVRESKIVVNDEVARSIGYSESDKYFKELENAVEKIKQLSNCVKTQDDSAINDEIYELFKDQQWRFNYWEIIETKYRGLWDRFEQRVPPGYCDGNKSDNKIGDVILFSEIVALASAKKECNNIVLISQDAKNDWCYAPQKIIDPISGKPRQKGDLRITDPLLQEEFSLRSTKNAFHVVTLNHFAKIIHEGRTADLEKLLFALSFWEEEAKNTPEVIKAGETDGTGKADQAVQPAEAGEAAQPAEAGGAVKANEVVETVETGKDNLSAGSAFNYSPTALEDQNFPLDDNKPATTIITLLRSHNWYTQNEAMDSVTSLQDVTPDALFVIGRNVYQAAVGNANSAISFLNNLGHNLAMMQGREHIFNGMLYEIYFDKTNHLRKDFKISRARSVFELAATETFSACRKFINAKLREHKANLLFWPGESIENVFTITVRREYEATERYFPKLVVTGIKKNGVEIAFHMPAYSEWVSDFEEDFSKKYGIPKQQVQVELKEVEVDSIDEPAPK